MNRYFIKLTYFHIKKEKWLFCISLVVIYLFGLPICLNTLNSSLLSGDSSLISCFNAMQKILLSMVLIIQSILFRPYIDVQYKDVIYSLDKTAKWKYIFIYMVYIEVILLPFHLIIYTYCQDMGGYLLLISMQIFILMTLYYGISMITQSSLISIGILSAYLFFFSFMYTEQGIGSFILLNIGIDRIKYSYYIGSIITILLMIFVGNFFEKRFLN